MPDVFFSYVTGVALRPSRASRHFFSSAVSLSREYIVYCYEPGVYAYTDAYHGTTFPAVFFSQLHLEINDTGV